VALIDRTDAGRRAVRLLGVGVHNLCGVDAPEPPSPEPDEATPRLPFE
jgi:hypothetical protein